MSQVVVLLLFILVNPATSATSKRSYCALPFLGVIYTFQKIYLRTMMLQERLNYMMLLHVHKGEHACKPCCRNPLSRRGIFAAYILYLGRMIVTPSIYYSDVGGGGSYYYRNVICIAGAVDTVAI